MTSSLIQNDTSITVLGYLTETKLGELLDAWVLLKGGSVLRQAKVTGTRMRHDFKVVTPYGRTLHVEYDGDTHYRDANVVYRDMLKDAASSASNIPVVRIPYFVQLEDWVFEHLFGEPFGFGLNTDYGQGFRDTKMVPASFCPKGLERFTQELATFPDDLHDLIIQSLDRWHQRSGMPSDFVTPY